MQGRRASSFDEDPKLLRSSRDTAHPHRKKPITCYPSFFTKPNSKSSQRSSYHLEPSQTEVMKLTISTNRQISIVLDKRPTEVDAYEEVLLTVPGAVVHLIDGQESVHLATGDFCLVRLIQKGNGIALFSKVGEELQWPIAKDAPTMKLDGRHYFFALQPPGNLNDAHGESGVLSYGVTFTIENFDFQFKQLDKFLQEYSSFSAPSVVRNTQRESVIAETKASEAFRKQNAGCSLTDCILLQPYLSAAPASLPNSATLEMLERNLLPCDHLEGCAEYWTALAPNLESYSGKFAKGVAVGSYELIKSIFWCSDTTVSQLEKGGLYLKELIKPNSKPIQISSHTMQNLKRVRHISMMTEKVTLAVLQGIIITTGAVTGAFINSQAGRKFLKLVPGEVVLASLDAFAKVFDAVEIAGMNVWRRSNEVASSLISHRYGEEAGAAAKEGLATASHIAKATWTLSKIRKAMDPKEGIKNSTMELLKSAVLAAQSL